MSEDIVIDSSAADSAASSADSAAREAEVAAAAAGAAAINQGQMIEAVTQAAREDAGREANRSEEAAAQSEAAAEIAVMTLETFASEMRAMMEEHSRRLDAVEQQRNEPAPVVVDNDVMPVEAAEQRDAQHENLEGTESSAGGSRRRHGRKRR